MGCLTLAFGHCRNQTTMLSHVTRRRNNIRHEITHEFVYCALHEELRDAVYQLYLVNTSKLRRSDLGPFISRTPMRFYALVKAMRSPSITGVPRAKLQKHMPYLQTMKLRIFRNVLPDRRKKIQFGWIYTYCRKLARSYYLAAELAPEGGNEKSRRTQMV